MASFGLHQSAHSSHGFRSFHVLTTRYVTVRPSLRHLVRGPVRGMQIGPSVSDHRRPPVAPSQPRPEPISIASTEMSEGLYPSRPGWPVRYPCLARLLGLVLLVGLAACGSPSPEAPGLGPPTGSADASRADLAVRPPGGPAPTQIALLGPTTQPASTADAHSATTSRAGGPVPPAAASSPDPSPSDLRAHADQAPYEARQQWLAELRAHPDAAVRLQALALWAEQPDDDLEPVFEALEDDDEQVRTRAEEVWEQQLAQEEGASEPAKE